ncbi:thioredoxin-related transmembrane protein 1-like [Pomacea canaliculata]|uniref:thioredoxin-related transmembrane protein 1-like n=1 Tax=Pomacea canaliculata TaxID=400727 RepID=UPI000D728557|nr:thioredoxin-related transmembrane protein 1-like [Pomacea canaliculata]
MADRLLSVAALCLLFCPTFTLATKAEPLQIITDDNWHSILEGEWMIEFMAPWCPACRSFQPVWQGLAEWSRDLDINVAVVDVTENPGLSGRFLVTSLPTVYHVKNGEFRVYQGPRRENDLLSFVDDKKWEEITPVSSWAHPNSYLMSAVGFFFRLALYIRGFYTTMTTVYGIPEWGCYIILAIATIITGLMLGLMFVLCCDWLFPPKYSPRKTIPKVCDETGSSQEKDDESDLLDDSAQEVPTADSELSKGETSVRKRKAQNKDAASEVKGNSCNEKLTAEEVTEEKKDS